MARQYAKLYTSMWSTDFRALSIGAQHLYMVIISNPKISSAGCLAFQPRKWAAYTANVGTADIEAALAELMQGRYVLVDDATEEVLVRSFIRHDGGYRNKYLRKSVETAIDTIESPQLKAHARTELDACTHPTEDGPEDPSEQSYEDPSKDPYEDPCQGAYEANYNLQLQPAPSTPPINSSTQPVSVSPAGSNASSDDGEEQATERTATVDEIIDAIIAKRSAGVKRTNPAGYLRSARENFNRKERATLVALLDEFPHWARGPEGADFAAVCYIGRAQVGAA